MKKHRVLVEEPHPQSYAALIMLVEKLQKETIKKWLMFRNSFLQNIIDKTGSLVCVHCGKKDLVIETENVDVLATVDHIIPLSKGGAMYNPDNCLVACFPCNNNRKNLDIDVFHERLKRSKGKNEKTDDFE